MGIYTNTYATRGDAGYYTDVEPFVGESFNYHELGIIAASEITANNNAFMKSIALAELSALEQYGDSDIIYEAFDFGSFLNKIKMFFKKIIEKIHKIFHTFIAKMASWFGNNKEFAKKYEKEVIKGWANVKNDWDYKGYNFEKLMTIIGSASKTTQLKAEFKDGGAFYNAIKDLMNTGNLIAFNKALGITQDVTAKVPTPKNKECYFADEQDARSKFDEVGPGKGYWHYEDISATTNSNGDKAKLTFVGVGKNGKKGAWEPKDANAYYNYPTYQIGKNAVDKDVSDLREKLPDIKDGVRKQLIDAIKTSKFPQEINFTQTTGIDQKEFSDELYQTLRGDEDSKTSLEKSEIEKSYGGSISSMMNFIKDFSKTKKSLEDAEKSITKCIDDLIKKVDNMEDAELKRKDKSGNNIGNEHNVQIASLYQNLWGCASENITQVFAALLQAQKEACTQAKEIAVKVIGQSKKMTEESYDYSNSYSSNNNGYDFISSVKLI